MCLAQIRKQKPKQSGYGWKRMVITKTEAQGIITGIGVPYDTWVDAQPVAVPYKNSRGDWSHYKSGFHIWLTKPNFYPHPSFQLVRVRYRKARILGEERYLRPIPTVIADQIYIANPQKKGRKK